MPYNTITVRAINNFANLEDLAFALQAEVVGTNKLKVNSKLVDISQFEYVLPVYGFKLVTHNNSIVNFEKRLMIGWIILGLLTPIASGVYIHHRSQQPISQEYCEGYDCF